ncbi:hypothetical protein R3P38DRAFT_2777077 [Favolaschia claudopus]|uniref:Uncharacterized protein n=1 Tax=Favolaschia claudopus TaxID=2862362 RepID=A0AAW0BKK3_9AGAR
MESASQLNEMLTASGKAKWAASQRSEVIVRIVRPKSLANPAPTAVITVPQTTLRNSLIPSCQYSDAIRDEVVAATYRSSASSGYELGDTAPRDMDKLRASLEHIDVTNLMGVWCPIKSGACRKVVQGRHMSTRWRDSGHQKSS